MRPDTRRYHVLLTSRLIFLATTVAALVVLLLCGFTDENRHRYISQMNDAGSGGSMILGLVCGAALSAAVIAILHGRHMGALLRIAIALLVWWIMTTKASSGDHMFAYFVVIFLYGFITVFAVMTLAEDHELLASIAVPLGFAAVVLMFKSFGEGPSGQKAVLIGFMLIEVLTVFWCYPRRLAWFQGVDGT